MREDFDKLEKVIAQGQKEQKAQVEKERRPWTAFDWGLLIAALSAFTLVITFTTMMWVTGQDIHQIKAHLLGRETPPARPLPTKPAVSIHWEQLFPPEEESEEAWTDEETELAGTDEGKIRIRVVGEGPFSVLEAVREGTEIRFQSRRMQGVELTGSRADARRRVPSMNQRDFPEPESGCGPIAIVNWLLWMQNEGILRKPMEGSNDWVLAHYNFRSVEREIFGLRGERSDRLRGGSNILEIAAAMDRIVYQLSAGAIRMHNERFDAPIRVNDWVQFTRGHRVGILVCRIVEDPATRRLGGYHAVSLVAGDRGGGVMLNNWGEQVYGVLRNERDGQFFYPENVSQPPLKVEYAVCFIPFRPAEDFPPALLGRGTFAGPVRTVPAPPRRIVRPAPAPAVSQSNWNVQLGAIQSSETVVFRITNRSNQARAIYLRSFQARTPLGRMVYPMDVRPARQIRYGHYEPYGRVEDLVFRPGESKDVWFRFAQLEFQGSPPPRIVETDVR